MIKELKLHNDINEVPLLAEFIEVLAEELGYNASDTMNLNLALEEAVVNVMNYAYPEGTVGDILLQAATTDTDTVAVCAVVIARDDVNEDEIYEMILFRIVEEDGEEILETIDDEDEMEAVYEIFMDRLFEEDEE